MRPSKTVRQAGQRSSPWFRRRALPPVCALLILGAAQVRVERGGDPLGEPEFLPVDAAFAFSAHLDGGRLVARWTMPDGYYLYRHAFRIEAEGGVVLGDLAIPAGKRIEDAYFGASEVYYGHVEIAATVLRGVPASARFHYQGCADAGLCYPPQARRVTFEATDEAGDAEDGANVEDHAVP